MWEKGMLILVTPALAALAFLVGVMVRDSSRFAAVTYRIVSPKLRKGCRGVMLSDLHNKEYGEHNRKLVRAIEEQKPDFILIAGDMVTANKQKTQTRVPLDLLRQLTKRYPVYYGMGNHEYRMKIFPEDYGDMFSLEAEWRFYKKFRRSPMAGEYVDSLLGKSRTDCLEVLLAHNPDYFKQYAAWGADLVLAGHVHGGMVRLPGLGGVISPSVHFFPKYDGGLFEEYGSRMILGRGLGAHTIPVRLFNPGELVVVDFVADSGAAAK